MGHATLFQRLMVAFLAGLTVTVAVVAPAHGAEENAIAPTDGQRKAVAALHAAGATIAIDGNYEVVRVSFARTLRSTGRATDDTLVHLKALPKLESLSLSGSGITDAGLEHLKGLGNLRTLTVFSSGVTAEAIDRLRQALPECRIVTLRSGGARRSSGASGGSRRGPFGFFPISRATLIGQLIRREVQTELKLTEGQREQINDLAQGVARNREYQELSSRYRQATDSQQRTALRSKLTKLRERQQQEANTKAKGLLKPEQNARAHELVLRATGTRAMLRVDVAKALALTDDQQQKIRSLNEEQSTTMRQLSMDRREGKFDLRTYVRRIGELSQQTQEKILDVLSQEQRGKWTEMLGPPGPRPRSRFSRGRDVGPRTGTDRQPVRP